MAEQGSKVSFHCGKKVSQSHNIRDFNPNKWNTDGHIDYTKSYLNEVIADHIAPESWMQWCESVFGAAIDDYNEKNRVKHPDRVIDKEAKYREFRKEVQESIVQVGNEEFNPLSQEEHSMFLNEVIEHWKKENPSLMIVGAYIHYDETTPHLHLDWLPVAHSSRGLSVKVSMDGALKDIGIGREKNQKYGESPYRRFLVQERAKLEEIGARYTQIIEADHTSIKTHAEYYEKAAKDKMQALKAEMEHLENETFVTKVIADAEEGRLQRATKKREEEEKKLALVAEQKEKLEQTVDELTDQRDDLQDETEKASRELEETKSESMFFQTLKEVYETVRGTDIKPEIISQEPEKKNIFGKVTPATVTITQDHYTDIMRLAVASEKAIELNKKTLKAAEEISRDAIILTRSAEHSIEVAKDSRVQAAENRAERAETENKSLKAEVKELREWKEETKDYPELKERVSFLEEFVESLKSVAKSLVRFLKGETIRERNGYSLYKEEECQDLTGFEKQIYDDIEPKHHFRMR